MDAIGSPFSVVEMAHTPDGESDQAKKGQLPRIHPDACHSPVAAKFGGVVSRTYSVTACTASSAFAEHVAFPHTICKPQ